MADLLGRSRVSMTYFGRGQQSRASADALAFVDSDGQSDEVGNQLATGLSNEMPSALTRRDGGAPGDRTQNPRITNRRLSTSDAVSRRSPLPGRVANAHAH
ncbi:hypothetical protein GCM10027271_13100 [Saccharopolyspora gloriosae]